MLYLTIGALIALIAGGFIIKFSSKLVGFGIVLALVGAALTVTTGIILIRDDQSKTAKCASLDGHFGGGSCYVQGVEKDLDNIEDFFEHK